MVFQELGAQLGRLVPEGLKARLGEAPALVPADSANASVTSEAHPSLNANEQQASGGDRFTNSPHPPLAAPHGVPDKLPHQSMPPAQHQSAQTAVHPQAGGHIRPLTVDEMMARFYKKIKPKPPKFSISPDKIRINPMALEQEALERHVFSLPWDDHNVLNPFHTGPCNKT